MDGMALLAKTVRDRLSPGSTPEGVLKNAETTDEKLLLLADLFLDSREWRREESQIIAETRREVRRLTEHVVELYKAVAPESTPGSSFGAAVRAAYRRKGGAL